MKRNWANLSPTYRKRLERGGITKKAYNSGANLQIARGHGKQLKKKVEKKKQLDPVHCPGGKFRTLKWFEERKVWLEVRKEGIDSGYCPPNLPPWWIIFS